MYEYLVIKLRERTGVQWAIVRHSNLEILYKVGKWEQVAVRRLDMDNADGVDRRIVLVQLRRRDRREGLVPARSLVRVHAAVAALALVAPASGSQDRGAAQDATEQRHTANCRYGRP